jgi:hypothetical protein
MTRAPFATSLATSDIQPFLDTAARFNMIPRRVTAEELMGKA